MKEAEELLAEQKRSELEYVKKLTDLADSILETRIKVNEMMAGQLMDYYSIICSSLQNHEVFDKALQHYYDGGSAGLEKALVEASDYLRLECHKVKTQENRLPFM